MAKNKEKLSNYCKEWRKNNKSYDSTTNRKEYKAKYRKDNAEKIAKKVREYSKNNKEHLREKDKPKRKLRYIKKLENPLFQVRTKLSGKDIVDINSSDGIIVTNATYGEPRYRYGFIPTV